MAYAAVVSLVQTLKQLIHSDSFSVLLPKTKVEPLLENVSFLQSFLEKIPSTQNKEKLKNLESRIRDALYEATDVIESHISNEVLSATEGLSDDSYAILSQQLQHVVEAIESIADESRKIEHQYSSQDPHPSSSTLPGADASRLVPINSASEMVGLDDILLALKDQLTRDSAPLEIVPLVGMGGIGKTTLARHIYHDKLIKSRFSPCAWVTVSQEYRVRDILLGLLESMNKLNDKMRQDSDDTLQLHLHKSLKGYRFLIVMDDMWDSTIWDSVRRFFPNDKNASRVVLTTRLWDVALYANSCALHKMRFLNKDESWDLLCKKVFPNETCPPQLEEIGKEIAESCQGLPLSIIVVGGILFKADKSVDYWKMFAEDIHSAIATSDDPSLEILALSYNHLPQHLKACFLYMGVFPEDSEIHISKLIQLWVAEGFLKSVQPKSLEEVAVEYVEDLVGRSLILVRKLRSSGRIKTCNIHDRLRDVCLREAQKEKFYHVISRYYQDFLEGTESQRRLSIQRNVLLGMQYTRNLMESVSGARSLLCTGPHHLHPLPVYLDYKLLRVLDALTIYFIEVPDVISRLFHLRYLSLTCHGRLPSSISKLQNLQILIVRHHPKIIFLGTSYLPIEIWNMPQLRHLYFTESELPDPPSADFGKRNSFFLGNLQTLLNVSALSLTKNAIRRIPNLKKLGIWTDSPGAIPFFLEDLCQLETFKFSVLNPIPGSKIDFQPKLSFPSSIKKLSLSGCGIPWEDITILGQLQNLEVLKLREFAFQGPVWEPNQGEFHKLKFLLLEALDLVNWKADESHFPSLASLIIRHCYDLEDIPLAVGNIDALKMIELVDCSTSVESSVKKIQQEQEDYGIYDFQVRVHSSWK